MARETLDSLRRPTTSRRDLLRLLGLGAGGLLAAPLASACAAAPSRPVVVDMTSLDRYDPGALTVAPGTRVVWKNTGTAPHTVTCQPGTASEQALTKLPGGAQPWDSGDVYPGQTWTHTFDTAGTYVYVDRYAAATGMVGVVTVRQA